MRGAVPGTNGYLLGTCLSCLLFVILWCFQAPAAQLLGPGALEEASLYSLGRDGVLRQAPRGNSILPPPETPHWLESPGKV